MTGTPTTVQAHIPVSTYRLQFNRNFTFEQATALVEYLHELGISDCYSSPILMARPGSLHGYDVVDHSRLNPELGTEEQFVSFASQLRQHGMGILMDVVPNHMCIADSHNRWWLDVLENGPSSQFARFFDIDWNPPANFLVNKVLLPVLGDQYGRMLENQELRVIYRGGAFFVQYFETTLPIAPRTTTYILKQALDDVKTRLDESHPDVLELESIITALAHLPPRTVTDKEKVKERRREKEVIKRRLASLVKESREIRHSVHEAIAVINGRKGDPRSFDLLEQLLAEQAYRLSYWRVAADEINYRRFFDINELAAVRVEERPVFNAVHEITFRLMKQGWLTGLRIDHVDGLFDPEKYLRDLQRVSLSALKQVRSSGETGKLGTAPGPVLSAGIGRPCYIVVEKILGHDELLRPDWPVYGTTGYEFMNMLNGVFVEHTNGQAFRELYTLFTGLTSSFSDILYESKKLILRVAMSSELNVLSRRLDRISEQHRYSRDFTLNSLQDALSEVIACFPVYRTYVRAKQWQVNADDRLHIKSAIRAAKRRNPAISESVFDFIGSVLLLKDPEGLTEAERSERREFVMRFQQLTPPVTAKGLEDTAFYRFYPLASLNEVGGDPAIFGITLERFHRKNQDRLENWPHSLSATSSHDTKRSEDVRARINVLSEMPGDWNRAIHRWQRLNRDKKAYLDGAEAPDANEEYLLYQTLVGAWPLGPLDHETHKQFVARIQEYMNKALKEAKVHTSWINPNEAYDQAVREFIDRILEPNPENQFLMDFIELQNTTAQAGMFNSLSQALLKITSPGVPDFYQGTEIWDFSLVDPDNRRPVDYERRKALLASLREEEQGDQISTVNRLMRSLEDGRIKLYVTNRALAFRRSNRELFATGEYLPLNVEGKQNGHVVAFARKLGELEVIAAASRFFIKLGVAARPPLGSEVWGDSVLALEGKLLPGTYRDVFTGRKVQALNRDGGYYLPLAEVFANLPVALLERIQ